MLIHFRWEMKLHVYNQKKASSIDTRKANKLCYFINQSDLVSFLNFFYFVVIYFIAGGSNAKALL